MCVQYCVCVCIKMIKRINQQTNYVGGPDSEH